jgi:hypothetical protein
MIAEAGDRFIESGDRGMPRRAAAGILCMAGTEEWFRPNKRMLAWGSGGGNGDARGGLRLVARTPKPRAKVLSGGAAKEQLGAAQSDENLKPAPKAVYGRLAPAREAQSDDD